MSRIALPLALAVLSAVAAVLLLLAAFDVVRWEERVAEDDVRFGTRPGATDLWQPSTLVPGDPIRRALDLRDDLRYRDAVQSFYASRPRESTFEHPELEAARVDAQVELRAAAEAEHDTERRSELVNLLGALATAVAPRQEQQRRVESLESAAAYFTEAVRLDRTNQDAMYNLEVVLRRLQDEPRSFESPGGRLPRDEASMGGLRDAGLGLLVSIDFLTPEAVLLAVGALLPLVFLIDGERRADVVRFALGLAHPTASQRRLLVVSIAALGALLGFAAAQPVLSVKSGSESRQDTEVWFVLDTSRSMLASESLRGSTRFDRAKRDALAIRRELHDVPSGVASLTDRLLPHVFPTEDAGVFGAVVDRVVGIDRPPPASYNVTATTLGALSALVNRNFYERQVKHRVAIVFTDAESRPFATASIGRIFNRPPGVRAVFVRYGNTSERVYTLAGGAERGYTPDPNAPNTARALAQATGGEVFDEGSTKGVADKVRELIGSGETSVDSDDRREVPLAPYSVALAFLPLALVLWRRNL